MECAPKISANQGLQKLNWTKKDPDISLEVEPCATSVWVWCVLTIVQRRHIWRPCLDWIDVSRGKSALFCMMTGSSRNRMPDESFAFWLVAIESSSVRWEGVSSSCSNRSLEALLEFALKEGLGMCSIETSQNYPLANWLGSIICHYVPPFSILAKVYVTSITFVLPVWENSPVADTQPKQRWSSCLRSSFHLWYGPDLKKNVEVILNDLLLQWVAISRWKRYHHLAKVHQCRW